MILMKILGTHKLIFYPFSQHCSLVFNFRITEPCRSVEDELQSERQVGFSFFKDILVYIFCRCCCRPDRGGTKQHRTDSFLETFTEFEWGQTQWSHWPNTGAKAVICWSKCFHCKLMFFEVLYRFVYIKVIIKNQSWLILREFSFKSGADRQDYQHSSLWN